MRRALILVLACGLAGCSLTGPKPDAGAGMGNGGISETSLAAPQAGKAPAAESADAGRAAGTDNAVLAAIRSILPQGAGAAAEVQEATPDTPHPAPRPAAASDGVSVPALSAAATVASASAPAAPTVPTVQQATADTPHPKARPAQPDTTQAVTEPAAPPPKPKSTMQIRCEASGGVWGQVGNSALYICQKKTDDGGQVCHKKSDCQGECLAGVGTCAPVEPLLGCNDVLDEQGRRTTLCLN